jgi:hypothetical protein
MSKIDVAAVPKPDRFHKERVAEYGVFAGRDGPSTASAAQRSPDRLALLAAVPWMSHIEPIP